MPPGIFARLLTSGALSCRLVFEHNVTKIAATTWHRKLVTLPNPIRSIAQATIPQRGVHDGESGGRNFGIPIIFVANEGSPRLSSEDSMEFDAVRGG